MPHLTPVQIACGSATVIPITFVLLLLAPTGSALAVTVIAVVALLLGAAVAVTAQARRAARRRPAEPVPHPRTAPERQGVQV
ncbi:hypothetical protein [Streptomyces litchfieldiae]|uniref:Uncharacterized protein n=1 Tax=Streptomyces litchfieldiae TaxID=3075543 RepID=A0ABU2MNR4_9ACTN|nr:hypothetical protein [Streptomyces sp. DSM 44938]MDT0342988.1 hypothetical protein [Streptomyces sp. DSM 44938]